jgi:hypothetical protein
MRLDEIDTAVQALRRETDHKAFTRTLAHVVSALGAFPDDPPQGFTTDAMARLRRLADTTVDAVEARIESGGDADKAQQLLAGTIYEIRRRMETIELWFRHRESV